MRLGLLDKPVAGNQILIHDDMRTTFQHHICVPSSNSLPPPLVIDTPHFVDGRHSATLTFLGHCDGDTRIIEGYAHWTWEV